MKMPIPFRKREYVLFFPQDEKGKVQSEVAKNLKQGELEKNFSSESRKVVKLRKGQLKKVVAAAPGVEVFEDQKIKLPKSKSMGLKLLDLSGSPTPLVDKGVLVHGADKLHEIGIEGNSSKYAPIIVTIDTGIDPHPDFGNRIKFFVNQLKNRREAPFDDHGHGTHVTGIEAANGKLRGMAPKADIGGVKALDGRGSGSYAGVFAAIESAIREYDEVYAPAERPMVINLSLGGPAGEVAKDMFAQKLPGMIKDRDIYFSFAAGNSGSRANTIGSPAITKDPKAAAVAAMDTKETVPMSDDAVTSFSSRGGNDVAKGQDALRVGGVAADGFKVKSTYKGGAYAEMSRTSMAAPFDAGAIAELLDYRGKLYADGLLKVKPRDINVLDLLRESAEDHANIDADAEGHGEIAVDRAAVLLVSKYGRFNHDDPQAKA